MSDVNKHILITGLFSLLIEQVRRIELLICTMLITWAYFLLRFNGNVLRFFTGFMPENFTIALSRFSYLEKFSLNFSSSLFAIRVNLLHP